MIGVERACGACEEPAPQSSACISRPPRSPEGLRRAGGALRSKRRRRSCARSVVQTSIWDLDCAAMADVSEKLRFEHLVLHAIGGASTGRHRRPRRIPARDDAPTRRRRVEQADRRSRHRRGLPDRVRLHPRFRHRGQCWRRSPPAAVGATGSSPAGANKQLGSTSKEG